MAYLDTMTVNLLPHILDQSVADGSIQCLEPSPEATGDHRRFPAPSARSSCIGSAGLESLSPASGPSRFNACLFHMLHVKAIGAELLHYGTGNTVKAVAG